MDPTTLATEAPRFPNGIGGDWQHRMDHIVSMMRELSQQTDPQAMVRTYARRMREIMPLDGFMSLSRRGLEPPYYRVTRSGLWKEEINPWADKDRLPVYRGGILGDLIYSDEPRIIDDLVVPEDDPAAAHLAGFQSLMAMPNFDQGVGMNMTILLRNERAAFDRERFPENVWTSNLFGRATHNLVLNDELRKAYEATERELKIVADIQRSLLPKKLPEIATLELAAYYQTSRFAGGDYYDFFPLSDGRWGIMIADVSGHGTPAAVLMAVTHSIAHSYPGSPELPSKLLDFVNHHLVARYTSDNSTFVTAFYGIYDPVSRVMTYSSAGHNPPLVRRCSDVSLMELDGARRFPLGLFDHASHEDSTLQLVPGDQIILYTDGITEAADRSGRLFGVERLERAIRSCHKDADELIQSLLSDLEAFTGGQPATDDRTILVARVR
jgi:sigma-B regulation protein RsbU (phosphoserine phosphatase)